MGIVRPAAMMITVSDKAVHRGTILGADMKSTNLTGCATCNRHRNNDELPESRVTVPNCAARGVKVKVAAGGEGNRSSKYEHVLFALVTLHEEKSPEKKNMIDHSYAVSMPPQIWRSSNVDTHKAQASFSFRGGS